MMPAGLVKLGDRFNALSLRERVIVAASVALILVLGSWQFVVEPALKKHKVLHQQFEALGTDAQALDSQREELQRALENDPNRRMQEAILQLQSEKRTVDAELGDLQARLVSPSAMLSLLGDVLRQSPDVRVVSLQNLPAQAVTLANSESAAVVLPVHVPATTPLASTSGTVAVEPLLYRHDAELVVQGSFHALLGYLQRLESLQVPLIWSALEYQVLSYPDGELRLRVSTLGLYKEWLGG